MEIDKILALLRERGYLNTIQRYNYNKDYATVFQLISALGRAKTRKFVIDNENEWVYTQLAKWLYGDVSMQAHNPITGEVMKGNINKGIYLAGQTGSGKSYALDIMQLLARIDNVQVSLNGENRCIYWKNVRTDEVCRKFIDNGDISEYIKAQILCLHDLGAEPAESVYMGNHVQVLRQIIEQRGDMSGILTLFSSNVPMNHAKLRQRYGDRVASRLNEMCNYIELKGKDRRL